MDFAATYALSTLRLALIALPLVLLTACSTPTQLRLDAEVRRLCGKDGGIKVYEAVFLSADQFDQYGRPRMTYRKDSDGRYRAWLSEEYYFESKTDFLEGKDDYEVALMRFQSQAIRRSDGKVLGTSVRYVRRGGDVPGPWHPSSFACPPSPTSNAEPNLENSVFQKR